MVENIEVDLEDPLDVLEFINNSSDVVLMLNKLSPLIDISEKDSKNTKLMKLYLNTVTNSVMKLSNDFRSLVKYMNITKELDMDDIEAPTFTSMNNEELYS